MNTAFLILASLLLFGCQQQEAPHGHADHADHKDSAETIRTGPNGGRMLVDGPFAIELAMFETGVPPEYHAWPTLDGKPVPLDAVQLTVEVHRLGGKVNRFTFSPQSNYLRSEQVVTEPHSFAVQVSAQYANKTHAWRFDSIEGRTRIPAELAAAAGIVTELAGPANLVQTLPLYGRIAVDPNRQREVTARFPGIIRKVHKAIGDQVVSGEVLAVIESNESLANYSVLAPIRGVIVARNANPGEQSADHVLFTIVDTASVIAELSVFPRDRAQVQRGAEVKVRLADDQRAVTGKVDRVDVQTGNNQAVIARVKLNNAEGKLLTGSFVTAEVAVAHRTVPLAVKTSALQPFRTATVVFEQLGEEYEVRMLQLGEQHGVWAEVLAGIEPGARYVTHNSYLLKADVEKFGAAHDH